MQHHGSVVVDGTLPAICGISLQALAFCFVFCNYVVTLYLDKNSQALKKGCSPQKIQDKKRCEIKGGSQEMTVIVG